MAFGLFKKKISADSVYMNGHIYTQDPSFPWASAVACKDGKVLAVGDFEAMDEIVSEDTKIIDLKERYMFPGFIETHGTEILKAFSGQYLEIDPVWDLYTVLEELTDYAETTGADVVFGYGYNENILEDYDDQEEVCRLLDEVDADRPVIVLSVSGLHCWFNTAAAAIVSETAADEGVEFISTDYILNVLTPLDFEEAEASILESWDDMCDKGITAFFPLNTPEYFAGIYKDSLIAIIGESMPVKQRLFGSFYLNRFAPPNLVLHKLSQGKTDCIELNGLVTYDFLKLEISSNENLAYFSQEELNAICLAAAEKGYHIHLDALDQDAAEQAAETFRYLRSKGCKNNTLVMATDAKLPEDGEAPFLTTWQSDCLNASVFGHAQSVSDAVDLLTVKAAELLGVSSILGSIEQGKKADFTVFESNPLEKNLKYFSTMQASMTIVDGLVVYDLDQECDKEMYDLLISMRL